MTDTSQLDSLLRSDAPASVAALDQPSVDALAALVAAEHERRDGEGQAALDAALDGFPWPVRKAVAKTLGR